jgi:hypothetical protein
MTHSLFEPLHPIVIKISRIFNAEGHWMEPPNQRNDPGYFVEAFQHLIIQFIIENPDKSFMQHQVEDQLRRPEKTSECLGPPSGLSMENGHYLDLNLNTSPGVEPGILEC